MVIWFSSWVNVWRGGWLVFWMDGRMDVLFVDLMDG